MVAGVGSPGEAARHLSELWVTSRVILQVIPLGSWLARSTLDITLRVGRRRKERDQLALTLLSGKALSGLLHVSDGQGLCHVATCAAGTASRSLQGLGLLGC